MAGNVIRQDVVQIGFDVLNDPLTNLVKELNNFKKSLAGVDTDGLNDVADGANKGSAAIRKLKADLERGNEIVSKMKSGFSAVVHPIKTIKNGFSGVSKTFKSFASTLTEGKKGANGVGTAVKNLAKISVVKLTSGLGKIAKMSFNGLKKGVSAVGSALKTVTNIAGKAAGVLAKGVFAGVGAAGAGLAALGTSAIKSYSDFEQLKGGVEKIFDQADISGIMNDANRAYIDLNMSASEYLSVMNDTGATFAATMGDQKGYDTAKLGLQAISDYASGTGKNVNELSEKFTMITRSTSSYQSIADQFSGILPATSKDFLSQAKAAGFLSKGYKELTDVPVAEYQEAVANMLAKGTEALGLTGNTAAEAKKTLSGSLNTMKAAWSNFLTGMADENADFDALVENLIISVVAFGKNIVPRIKVLAPRLVEGFTKLTQSLAPELPGILNSVVPALVDGAIGLVDAFIVAIQSNLPMLSNMAVSLLTKLAGFFLTAMPQLMIVGLQIIVTLISSVSQQLPTLIPLAIQAIMMLANGLLMNLPIIIAAGVQVLMALANGIIAMLPQLVPIGIQLIVQFIVGIMQAIPQLLGMIPQIFFAFIEGLMSVNWLQVGTDVLRAIGDGILNGVKSFGSSIWEGVKGIFGGGNNKGEAQASGTETVSSFADGISNGTAQVNTATLDLCNNITTDMNLDLSTQGLETMTTFDTGLVTGGVTVNNTASTTADDIKKTFDELDLTTSGKSVMDGLIAGMNSMRNSVIETAKSIAAAVTNTINSALDINSPSGVAEWQAQMYGKGLVVGANKAIPSVQNASGRLSGAMYQPSAEASTSGRSYSQNNSYAPQFTLNLSGTVDRTTERTVKQWIKEALQDTFDGMGRTNPRLTEV